MCKFQCLICVEVIIYLILYNFLDCTFKRTKFREDYLSRMPILEILQRQTFANSPFEKFREDNVSQMTDQRNFEN